MCVNLRNAFIKTLFLEQTMCVSLSLSDSHRAIAFSIIHQLLSSFRAIDFSCFKHFAVLEILISRFSLPHTTASPSPDRAQAVLRELCDAHEISLFYLIFRFATTENGSRLWNLCKQVKTVHTAITFICF